jgi:hypothetical protein
MCAESVRQGRPPSETRVSCGAGGCFSYSATVLGGGSAHRGQQRAWENEWVTGEPSTRLTWRAGRQAGMPGSACEYGSASPATLLGCPAPDHVQVGDGNDGGRCAERGQRDEHQPIGVGGRACFPGQQSETSGTQHEQGSEDAGEEAPGGQVALCPAWLAARMAPAARSGPCPPVGRSCVPALCRMVAVMVWIGHRFIPSPRRRVVGRLPLARLVAESPGGCALVVPGRGVAGQRRWRGCP